MTDTPGGSPRRLSHEVIMECEGRTVGRTRNETVVTLLGQGGTRFEIATDEGSYPHGGDASAPSPLALFSASLVTCLMVQVKQFARRLKIEVRDVHARARLHWLAETEGRGPYVSRPVGFSIDLEIDSDAPTASIVELIAAAKQGCFVEQTLARPNTIAHRLKVGDGWIDV
jgi:uncharacterized OsmC-like protein